MAKPNYSYLKRQKEMAKQKKKEEKRKKKLARQQTDDPELLQGETAPEDSPVTDKEP